MKMTIDRRLLNLMQKKNTFYLVSLSRGEKDKQQDTKKVNIKDEKER